MLEYVLIIEFIPKIAIYRPDWEDRSIIVDGYADDEWQTDTYAIDKLLWYKFYIIPTIQKRKEKKRKLYFKLRY